jgi:hypothetical protein
MIEQLGFFILFTLIRLYKVVDKESNESVNGKIYYRIKVNNGF